eukprot:GCRY01002913.1.p1 GENE.GCRY01002913.1~~GCRY01002913.1.p1  ORF type:complete len:567 (-),score=111.38 GCRY01002913.1:145-1845(-)
MWNSLEQKNHFLVLLVLFIVVGHNIQGSVKKFQAQGSSSSHNINLDCQKSSEHDECDLPGLNRFSKIVWVFIDSLAISQIEPFLRNETYAEHANTYRIRNTGFKFSYALYTSFFTGQLPFNYAGKPIVSDNLFLQMTHSDIEMHYVGCNPTAWNLLHNIPNVFPAGITRTEPEQEYILPLLFSDPDHLSAETVAHTLDKYTNNGQKSVFFTSGRLDAVHHEYSRNHPLTHRLVNHLNAAMPAVRQWMEAHPEYLFILLSDHGGVDYPGQDRIFIHGPSDGGNEGFISFYNPSINPVLNQFNWIDTVDVCPTLAQYFDGVSIPFENLGLVAPQTDAPELQYQLLERNAHQLSAFARAKGLALTPAHTRLYTAAVGDVNHAAPDLKTYQEANQKLRQYIESVREPLISLKIFPTGTLLYLALLIAGVQAWMVLADFRGLKDFLTVVFATARGLTVFLPLLFSYLAFAHINYDSKRFFPLLYKYFFSLAMFVLSLVLAPSHSSSSPSSPSPSPFPSFSSFSSSLCAHISLLFFFFFFLLVLFFVCSVLVVCLFCFFVLFFRVFCFFLSS